MFLEKHFFPYPPWNLQFAPENRLPKRKGSSSNQQFSVSGRVWKTVWIRNIFIQSHFFDSWLNTPFNVIPTFLSESCRYVLFADKTWGRCQVGLMASSYGREGPGKMTQSFGSLDPPLGCQILAPKSLFLMGFLGRKFQNLGGFRYSFLFFRRFHGGFWENVQRIFYREIWRIHEPGGLDSEKTDWRLHRLKQKNPLKFQGVFSVVPPPVWCVFVLDFFPESRLKKTHRTNSWEMRLRVIGDVCFWEVKPSDFPLSARSSQ